MATGARFGFGRDRHIRRRADFLRVQSIGQRTTTDHFVLLVAASANVGSCAARLGIVATKKTGNAVCRNRIKRLCRECFRLWPDFVTPGIDLVVIARPGADTLSLEHVRREWERARPALLRRCAAVLAAPPPTTPTRRSARPVPKVK